MGLKQSKDFVGEQAEKTLSSAMCLLDEALEEQWELKDLQKLNLALNFLRDYSHTTTGCWRCLCEVSLCNSLEVITLEHNQITELPSSLVDMPHLTKLNLISYNPTCIYGMTNLVSLHMSCNGEQRPLTSQDCLLLDFKMDIRELQSMPFEMHLQQRLGILACHPLDKGLPIMHNPLLKCIK
uniref:Uncharacterized protein n=1 Tax=Scleropages formosus TaxID=113540 RepID=A0A8C9SX38_SCLFO